ncbi:hypothetical protein KUTeg_017648 [Tegillarca granosa]|uniref:Uncharacterized protein n=1 Tax=Tegillarca granosa TaxID=220873 RepID=A0ABQ9EL04_TEGGR|nr:hypothetical protein KUTeg_017648 [Tegillarca granosa]
MTRYHVVLHLYIIYIPGNENQLSCEKHYYIVFKDGLFFFIYPWALQKQVQEQNAVNNRYNPFFKPMSNRERIFTREHSIFLLRNLEKARQTKKRSPSTEEEEDKDEEYVKSTGFKKKDVFITQLTALKTARSVKTRRLALAEENSELAKTAKLAQIFNGIYNAVVTCKDEDGKELAAHLMYLPSKKKYPEYYDVIESPIDFRMIQRKVFTGKYQDLESFDKDITKLFKNAERYCGRSSWMGSLVLKLRKFYNTAKAEALPLLEDVLGERIVQSIKPDTTTDSTKVTENTEEEEEEEVIRCICGVYRDEGLMIQCEKCFIWQHCDCMKVAGDVENYLCELCNPRTINKEILADPQPDDATTGWTYYMTLMRDDLQIRVGDCVYVLREQDSKWRGMEIDSVRSSHRLVSNIGAENLVIFRIERLWKDESEKNFAFGHSYFRPHETFHEPSRKFFPNEVFRVPIYEIVSFDMIIGHCCVMDLNTYCKGKPKGIRDQDVYICEYRLDKTAHLFYKISKHPVPKRTYSPHEVPESYKRRSGTGERNPSEGGSVSCNIGESIPKKKQKLSKMSAQKDELEDNQLLSKIKAQKRKEKKDRVDRIMWKLLSVVPPKHRLDLSHLLDEPTVQNSIKSLFLPSNELIGNLLEILHFLDRDTGINIKMTLDNSKIKRNM